MAPSAFTKSVVDAWSGRNALSLQVAAGLKSASTDGFGGDGLGGFLGTAYPKYLLCWYLDCLSIGANPTVI